MSKQATCGWCDELAQQIAEMQRRIAALERHAQHAPEESCEVCI